MIEENLEKVRATIAPGVRLIAVSKTKPVDYLRQAYDAGQRLFGENHALEMRDKHAQLPGDIQWHFIGHLQSNKVKYIAPFVSLIHSIDSVDLLRVVDKEAAKNNRVIDCLLQYYVASEETKFGLSVEEGEAVVQAAKELGNVRLTGVMGMATNTDDEALIHAEFRNLKSIFDSLKQRFFSSDESFAEISMGMSGDYLIAMQEGSTLVRVGSAIFGARQYNV